MAGLSNQIRVMSVADNIKGIRPFTVDSVNPYIGNHMSLKREDMSYVLSPVNGTRASLGFSTWQSDGGGRHSQYHRNGDK
jgi:hypothetical protein